MSSHIGLSFAGDSTDTLQPSAFLKNIRIHLREGNVADADKPGAFGDYLKTGSTAEEWYEDTTTPKNTFTALEVAFKIRFPDIEKAKKTGVELERELGDLRIRIEELGITEKYAGEDVWTHVAFAERALDLAKRAKIHTSTNTIWQLRDKLPDLIRDKVSENQTDWTTFCTAIKNIEVSYLREGARRYRERMAEKDANDARLLKLERTRNAPTSNISSITNQMSKTSITATPYQQNTSQRNTSRTTFTPAANRTPPTEEQKTALRTLITAFPPHPNTPQGHTAYLEQCEAWRQRFGENQKVTETTGFPLRPGSAPVCSGECYACGKTGHPRSNCTADIANQINIRERAWRALCGSILGHRQAAQAVNMVNLDNSSTSWMHTAGSEDYTSQGNEEGPSA